MVEPSGFPRSKDVEARLEKSSTENKTSRRAVNLLGNGVTKKEPKKRQFLNFLENYNKSDEARPERNVKKLKTVQPKQKRKNDHEVYHPRLVKHLYPKELVPGTVLLGQVVGASSHEVIVALPFGVKGHARAEDCIEADFASSASMPRLAVRIPIGRWVSCVVIGNDEGTISLSLRPSVVNAGISVDALSSGKYWLPALVTSKEEKGFSLFLGVKGVSGFINTKKKVDEQTHIWRSKAPGASSPNVQEYATKDILANLHVGALIHVAVTIVRGKTAACAVDAEHCATSCFEIAEAAHNAQALKAGTLVQFRVQSLHSRSPCGRGFVTLPGKRETAVDAITVSLCKTLTGQLPPAHYSHMLCHPKEGSDKLYRPPFENQRDVLHWGRIIAVIPGPSLGGMPRVVISQLPHIVAWGSLTADKETRRHGRQLKDARIVGVEKDTGYHLLHQAESSSPRVLAFLPAGCAKGMADSSKWEIGTAITVRAITWNPVEGEVVVDCRLHEKEVASHNDHDLHHLAELLHREQLGSVKLNLLHWTIVKQVVVVGTPLVEIPLEDARVLAVVPDPTVLGVVVLAVKTAAIHEGKEISGSFLALLPLRHLSDSMEHAERMAAVFLSRAEKASTARNLLDLLKKAAMKAAVTLEKTIASCLVPIASCSDVKLAFGQRMYEGVFSTQEYISDRVLLPVLTLKPSMLSAAMNGLNFVTDAHSLRESEGQVRMGYITGILDAGVKVAFGAAYLPGLCPNHLVADDELAEDAKARLRVGQTVTARLTHVKLDEERPKFTVVMKASNINRKEKVGRRKPFPLTLPVDEMNPQDVATEVLAKHPFGSKVVAVVAHCIPHGLVMKLEAYSNVTIFVHCTEIADEWAIGSKFADVAPPVGTSAEVAILGPADKPACPPSPNGGRHLQVLSGSLRASVLTDTIDPEDELAYRPTRVDGLQRHQKLRGGIVSSSGPRGVFVVLSRTVYGRIFLKDLGCGVIAPEEAALKFPVGMVVGPVRVKQIRDDGLLALSLVDNPPRTQEKAEPGAKDSTNVTTQDDHAKDVDDEVDTTDEESSDSEDANTSSKTDDDKEKMEEENLENNDIDEGQPFLQLNGRSSSDSDSEKEQPASIVKKKQRSSTQREAATDNWQSNPQNVEDFERVVLVHGDSAVAWIKYMAHFISLLELDNARAVAERAIKHINFREETERYNVWCAYMNMEAAYGTQEHLDALVKRALQFNRPQKILVQLSRLHERRGEWDLAIQAADMNMTKHPQEFEVWERCIELRFRRSQTQSDVEMQADWEEARLIFVKALQRLLSSDHILLTTKVARMEYQMGLKERGRTLYESVLHRHPKRTDIWSQFLDAHIKAHTPPAISKKELEQEGRTSISRLFEQATSSTQKPFRMKFLFKKWLQFEQSEHGTVGGQNQVRQKAEEFIKRVEESA